MRYLKLFASFFRTSLIREIEFRSGFITLFLIVLAEMVMTVTFFSVLYGSVPSIKGWSYAEALLLVGTFMMLTNLTHALFYRNFSRMSLYVNEGRLDYLLTKPIDPQFFISLRYTAMADVLNMITSVIITVFAISRLHIDVSLGLIFGYSTLLILGIAIIYGIWFLISILSFWLTEVEEIQELWNSLFEYARYPRQIYSGAIRLLFTILIPLLTIVAFPAEFFLRRVSSPAIAYNLALAAGLLVATRLLWNVGLRRYSSASS